MGNCIPKPSKPKLIDNEGNLRRIDVPITAAELMFEVPGHIISPLDELCRTRRIPALKADDELQAGKVYFFFPEKRIYSKISELEIKLIDASCCKRKLKSKTKVFLASVMTDPEGEQREEMGVRLSEKTGSGFSGHRIVNSRPWMPILDPIYE